MSADYDRLFHSSEPAQPEEETVTVDPKAVQAALAAAASMPTGRPEAPAEPMPVTPAPAQAAAAPPPRATEVTTQMRPTPPAPASSGPCSPTG